MSSRAGTLQERAMRLRSEMTGVSVENAPNVQGLFCPLVSVASDISQGLLLTRVFIRPAKV